MIKKILVLSVALCAIGAYAHPDTKHLPEQIKKYIELNPTIGLSSLAKKLCEKQADTYMNEEFRDMLDDYLPKNFHELGVKTKCLIVVEAWRLLNEDIDREKLINGLERFANNLNNAFVEEAADDEIGYKSDQHLCETLANATGQNKFEDAFLEEPSIDDLDFE